MGAPLGLALSSAAAEELRVVGAAADGSAAIHDLGLAAGDYVITLGQAAGQVQPYTLRAVVVTDPDVDPEPNDSTGTCHRLDPGLAHGPRPAGPRGGRRPVPP